jgi:hypothetical protein
MCIEDFAVCDIGSLMKKYPEEFELSQHIMHQLAKKIFDSKSWKKYK